MLFFRGEFSCYLFLVFCVIVRFCYYYNLLEREVLFIKIESSKFMSINICILEGS